MFAAHPEGLRLLRSSTGHSERVGAGAGLPSTADRRGHSEGCAGTAAAGCEGAGWADPGLLIRCTELGVGHWRLLQMSGVCDDRCP